jgi:2-phosphosulfolactate phosphatase
MRPAIEDLGGVWSIAGRIKPSLLSAETRGTADAFISIRDAIAAVMVDCSSGRELTEIRFSDDVNLPSDLNVLEAVRTLVEGAFRANRSLR